MASGLSLGGLAQQQSSGPAAPSARPAPAMYCRSVDPFKPDNLSSKYSVVAVPCLEDNYAYLLIDD